MFSLLLSAPFAYSSMQLSLVAVQCVQSLLANRTDLREGLIPSLLKIVLVNFNESNAEASSVAKTNALLIVLIDSLALFEDFEYRGEAFHYSDEGGSFSFPTVKITSILIVGILRCHSLNEFANTQIKEMALLSMLRILQAQQDVFKAIIVHMDRKDKISLETLMKDAMEIQNRATTQSSKLSKNPIALKTFV